MKIINTLSVLFFLLVAVACSSESDTIMNDISNEIEATQQVSKEAYISLGVNVDVLSTKSVTPGGTDNITDQEIKSLAIFLLEGDKVINSAYLADKQFTVSEGVVMVNDNVFGILTKKKENLKVLIAANSSAFNVDNISSFQSEASIKTASANLDDCTKFGESSISWGDYPGYEKINGDDGALKKEPFNVMIKLSQSYARIELAEFNVIKKSDSKKDVDVELIGVELSNINKNGQVDGKGKNVDLIDSKLAFSDKYKCNIGDPGCELGKNIIGDNIYFRAFAYNYRNSESKMKMKLTYKVGLKTRTKEFIIQGAEFGTESVVAGYIYRMQVTATLKAEQVDLDVVFSIKNWIDGGLLIDGEMKEIGGN